MRLTIENPNMELLGQIIGLRQFIFNYVIIDLLCSLQLVIENPTFDFGANLFNWAYLFLITANWNNYIC